MADSADALTIVSSRRNLVVLLVICVLFTAMGIVVLALAPTKTLNLVVGIAAIGFFGFGGGVSLIGQWRRSVVLVADDSGIRITGAGRIPWADVDRIGATGEGLGIRLRRYDTFLSTAPAKAEHTAATLRAGRTQHAGYDLVFAERFLDRSPGEAARDLQRRRPVS
ncbi:hypothetical protein ET475_17355 [Microbacterium protaetiae]|uniref:PH domain-containing protein n=1 Tax=Microbacterium protaetiae TaxID=2509458 RepID=A0A4P6EU44_9MICO|nr:STM3941 family protein [Microbacterium protaetiae]QAY61558.1 hypothetical protein ET475_17355 [Microbacterium protaetiae]